MAPLAASSWLLPSLVFAAEMTVVTLGTLRIICIARGRKLLAPLLGFFEVLIWLFAMMQVMSNLGRADCFIAFALGFTLGNVVGMWVEQWLALGSVVVRAFCSQDPGMLVDRLRAGNFGVTCVEGRGAKGAVHIVLTVIKRRQLEEVTRILRDYQPGVFFAVEDLQTSSAGIFPARRPEQRQATIPTWHDEEQPLAKAG